MPFLTAQPIDSTNHRRYSVHVPDAPTQELVPAIIVFHGGGQDAATIAKRWSVDPPSPVPPQLANYLLVFPESDPGLGEKWVHLAAGDPQLPTHDLSFVRRLLAQITSTSHATGSADVPSVKADPALVYCAGFSNGGGMVWQLLHSDLAGDFRGFAAVGHPLDQEKVRQYRRRLAPADPTPAPVAYVHGTADRSYRPPFSQDEVPGDETLPFATVREMLTRNVVPAGPAATSLATGSTGVTEVVVQLFQGEAAFLQATVINGGHNWPMPTTVGNPPVAEHFDATATIVSFWRDHAGLPG